MNVTGILSWGYTEDIFAYIWLENVSMYESVNIPVLRIWELDGPSDRPMTQR